MPFSCLQRGRFERVLWYAGYIWRHPNWVCQTLQHHVPLLWLYVAVCRCRYARCKRWVSMHHRCWLLLPSSSSGPELWKKKIHWSMKLVHCNTMMHVYSITCNIPSWASRKRERERIALVEGGGRCCSQDKMTHRHNLGAHVVVDWCKEGGWSSL